METARSDHQRTVRIAEHDPGAHRDQAVHEEQAALEELLVDQHRPVALRGQHERQRREVRREARPRRVVDLRDRAVHIRDDGALLPRGHAERGALDQGLHPEPGEDHADHPQMVGRDVLDAQLAARHGGDGDERPDLNVIGPDAVPRGTKVGGALDLEDVAADPGDPRPHLVQGVTEALNVWLGGRVQEARGAVGHRGGHHRGLRSGDARLVQEHLGAPKGPRELQAIVRVVERDPGAELLERKQMRVEPPPADLVTARPRQHGETGAGEERRGEQERRPDLRGQRRVGPGAV